MNIHLQELEAIAWGIVNKAHDSQVDLAIAIRDALQDERERCAQICDRESTEYKKSMEEFDSRNATWSANREALCAVTAQNLAGLIRAGDNV